MANPAFVNAGSNKSNTGVQHVSVTTSSLSVGDVIQVAYSGYASGTLTPSPTLPDATWTTLKTDTQTGSGFTVFSYVAEKVAASTDVPGKTYTFSSTLPSGGDADCVWYAFSGQDSTTAIDDSKVAVVPNGTTATSPAATASVSNDTICCVYIDNGNTGAIPSLPTGLTNAVTLQDSAAGTGFRVGYADLSASGTTPTYTSTYGETVDPAGGIFGTIFTVLIKGATTSNSATGLATLAPTAHGEATQTNTNSAAGSATLTPSAAGAAQQTNSAQGAASVAPTAQGSAIVPGAWTIEEVQHNYQKWHTSGWSAATNTVTCAQGDSIIVAIQCWNNNSNGAYPATMTPVGLTTIYDPSATWTGTSEPVYCQLFAATDLAAGTYTITPPDLQANTGDGDMYVIRASGLSGIRSGSLGTDRQSGTNLVSTTSSLGSAAQAGDLVIGIGGTDNNTLVTTLTVSTPSGWTNLGKQTDGTNSPPSSCDYTTAIGGGQSATWTWANEASPVADSAVVAFIPSGASATGSASIAPTASGSALARNAAVGAAALGVAAAGTALAILSAVGSATIQPTAQGTASASQAAHGHATATPTAQGRAQASQNARGSATVAPTAKGSAAASQSATGSAQASPSAKGSAYASQAAQGAATVTSTAKGSVVYVGTNYAHGSASLSPTVSGIAQAYASARGTASATPAGHGQALSFLPAQGLASVQFAAHGTGYASQSAAGSVLIQPTASGTAHPPIQSYPVDPHYYAALPARLFYAAAPFRAFYAQQPRRSFYALCTSDMAVPIPYAIDPGETKVLTLDATADLPSGVTLTGTPTVEVVVLSGQDTNAASHFTGAVINSTPITVETPTGATVTIATGLAVQLVASGCVDGTQYEIRVTCQTSQSNNVEVLKATLSCTAS